jgi:large subunit ribosomal protein L31
MKSTSVLHFHGCLEDSRLSSGGRQSLDQGDPMKENLHPKVVPCKIIYNGEVVLETMSTKPEIHVDVWSGVHPYWTGQQRFLDTEGRVEKFQKRFQGSYRGKKK